MIPLRDNIPSRTTPYVNYALIALCLIVFLAQLGQGPDDGDLVERFGMIPARVLNPDEPVVQRVLEPVQTVFGVRAREVVRELASPAVSPWLTLLTCIFLHGGWLHLIGNLWILWIFGDNVEDRLGHWRYLVFYLGCGVVASGVHLATGPGSQIPTIGASGAIAGVMGAYFLLYPKATVLTLVPLIIILDIWVLPAPVFLGFWFVLQLIQGTFSLGNVEAGGVAWWAHIGGFMAGVGVALGLSRSGRASAPVAEIRPRTAGFSRYGQYPVYRSRRRRY